MLYLANPSTDAVIELMRAGRLGLIDQPGQRGLTRALSRIGPVPWAADNGCFAARWTEAAWLRFLRNRRKHVGHCLFALVPDELGNPHRTLELFTQYADRVRDLGYPVGFVAQDEAHLMPLPWDDFDALFIGGSTDFKLGAGARVLAAEARAYGKHLHMGRVNSRRRYEYARAIGCHSVDGTFLTFGPDQNVPRLLRWLDSSHEPLFTMGRND